MDDLNFGDKIGVAGFKVDNISVVLIFHHPQRFPLTPPGQKSRDHILLGARIFD